MSDWMSYNELAWLESVIAPPEDYLEETKIYCHAIKASFAGKPETMLHLGSGAGNNDFTFKKHFKVSGVDLSKKMLEEARKLNPEIEYVEGDMRTIRLKRTFDAVAWPDSSPYMATLEDLAAVFETAAAHLKPGGVFLVVNHLEEEFADNNFVYSGRKNDLQVTVFENNYRLGPKGNQYEATMVYLIRRNGELTIKSETHLLGLFNRADWLQLFREHNFSVKEESLPDLYERFIQNEGSYPLRLFTGIKN